MLYIALGVLLGLVLAAVFLALSMATPPDRLAVSHDVPPPDDPAFLELVGLHTEARFAAGHDVEILLDGGETFPRLFSDIRAARETVTIQLYYCQPGRLADALAEVLVDRAGAGVRVLFLYDAFGSALPESYFDRLREAGVEARVFRPFRWWSLHKAQERSHVRIVVVDGVIGHTGGFGLSDEWSAPGTDGERGWRETNARFTGPAVASLQAGLAAGWAETAGELLVGPSFYAHLAGAGEAAPVAPDGATAALMHSRPDAGSSPAERLLSLTIGAARRSLYLSNAYFVPNADFCRLLARAVLRGVDVRVLTASDNTDLPMARYAGRARYAGLLAAGVRLYEYRPSMMHAKTFVADGVWSGIGTVNLDNRSLAVNEEVMFLVQGRDVGARMEAIFRDDLAHATEITAEAFARRGVIERIKERAAAVAGRIL